MDLLLSVISHMLGSVGGKPGSASWDVITACFGWLATLSLVAALFLPWFEATKGLAGYAVSSFGFFILISILRDYDRVHAPKREKSGNT